MSTSRKEDAGTKLPAYVIREIAVRARRDPRTVERVLRGERAQPLAEADVREAARELGHVLPDTSPEPPLAG